MTVTSTVTVPWHVASALRRYRRIQGKAAQVGRHDGLLGTVAELQTNAATLNVVDDAERVVSSIDHRH